MVRAEPDWQALPAATPVKVRDLLRRCLQKDKRLRLRDAGDAQIEIQEALAAPATAVAATAAPATRGWRERLAWLVLAGVLALIAIAFAIGFVLRAPKPPQPSGRLSAEIGVDASLYTPSGLPRSSHPTARGWLLSPAAPTRSGASTSARSTSCRPPRFPARRMPAIPSFRPMASGSAFSPTAS